LGGFFVLLALLAVTAGCGDPYKARAVVKGQVKFFDKHLTAGTVAFIAKDGRVGSGNIDFDGNYAVHDAPIGEVTITVSVPKMGAMGGKNPHAKPPPGLPPMRPPGGSGGNESPEDLQIDPKKFVQIPGKYEKAETSGLNYTVEKGETTYNITLTP
jgi:hypothetical protein